MAKTTNGTTPYNGKDIPLTADGLPNKVYLSKEDRGLVTEARVQLKSIDKEKRQGELRKFLQGLSK
ncbi:MAG: hypothetical protein ACI9FW_001293 [Flavobacterium sp.]|jgi:hypothetical protein